MTFVEVNRSSGVHVGLKDMLKWTRALFALSRKTSWKSVMALTGTMPVPRSAGFGYSNLAKIPTQTLKFKNTMTNQEEKLKKRGP